MITTSKTLPALALALLLCTGAAQAADRQVRIAHPNGPATYIYVPNTTTETVAVYASGQGPAPTVYRQAEKAPRTVTIHQGRGQSKTIRVGQ